MLITFTAMISSTKQANSPKTIDKKSRLTNYQKKFTDAINGKSGLTYADAIASEVRCLILHYSTRAPTDTTIRTRVLRRSNTSSLTFYATRSFAKSNSQSSVAWTSLVCTRSVWSCM